MENLLAAADERSGDDAQNPPARIRLAGSPHQEPEASGTLGRASIALLAAACGLVVANANYAQPLLLEIARTLHMSDAAVGLVPALTQTGVLLLLPLGDVMPARRLLTVVISLQAIALAATSVAPTGPLLIALSFAIGFCGITPYILPPYATLRTPAHRRGHVTALLAQGVIVGMLLARSMSGWIGLHSGWRTVYGMAAGLMLLLLWPLRRTILLSSPHQQTPLAPRPSLNSLPTHSGPNWSYPTLLRSLVDVLRNESTVRRSALCQAFNWGSFNAMWIGLTFQMQGPAFGWHSDGVGALAIVGAASAVAAPFVGRIADRKGPRWSLLSALGATVAAWAVLTAFGLVLPGIVIGLILLDMGTTAADISNRTVIFSLHPAIRTRIATIYMVSMFTGGAVAAWLAGLCWSFAGWPAVCALGATAAGLSALTAWRG
jgi:predicted MFS family arabinose efflux permease